MKLFTTILVGICFLACALAIDEEWEEFKTKFEKVYLSPTKENKRKAAFAKHKATYDDLKAKYAAGQLSYEPEMYGFHDLEPEEMAARLMGLQVPSGRLSPAKVVGQSESVDVRQSLPTDYDARKYVAFGTPRNQGSCGSCWAFSATNAMEVGFAKFKNNNVTFDLSEQQLVDCVYTSSGCGGGWMSDAWNYLKGAGGQAAESSYAYSAVGSSCQASTKTKYAKVANWTQITNSTAAIQSAIMKYGSLSIAVDASQWSFYKGGIFNATSVGGINHGVNLVGWGYNATLNKNYWLIRNSWGPNWGEGGYIKVLTTYFGTYFPYYTYAVNLL